MSRKGQDEMDRDRAAERQAEVDAAVASEKKRLLDGIAELRLAAWAEHDAERAKRTRAAEASRRRFGTRKLLAAGLIVVAAIVVAHQVTARGAAVVTDDRPVRIATTTQATAPAPRNEPSIHDSYLIGVTKDYLPAKHVAEHCDCLHMPGLKGCDAFAGKPAPESCPDAWFRVSIVVSQMVDLCAGRMAWGGAFAQPDTMLQNYPYRARVQLMSRGVHACLDILRNEQIAAAKTAEL